MSRRRSRRLASVSIRSPSIKKTISGKPLSYFRLLTPIKKNVRISKRFKSYNRAPQRVSSVKVARGLIMQNIKRLNFDFQSWRGLLELDKLKVCRERKERRRCIFAFGKEGGNHKPPTYTLKSLVKC